jgi:hypothetical protein
MLTPTTNWRVAAAALALLLLGCRYQPTPVPLQGAASNIAALSGTWEGEYIGAQSGRSGTITFTVQAGKDTAFGDVTMMAGTGNAVIAADVESRVHATHSRSPALLVVKFVSVRGGLVEGVLEPYLAPDCSCVVTTTFRGAVEGDVISGEYVTTGQYGLRHNGRWSIRRKHPNVETLEPSRGLPPHWGRRSKT